jgi:transposase
MLPHKTLVIHKPFCLLKNSSWEETVVIGHEESSQLDVEPAKYFVLVSKREKRACKSCEERGVVSAPLPPRIIEKCLASDQIVIDTVVSKYCDHTPLYRQSAILERDTGLELSRATRKRASTFRPAVSKPRGPAKLHKGLVTLWESAPGLTVAVSVRETG